MHAACKILTPGSALPMFFANTPPSPSSPVALPDAHARLRPPSTQSSCATSLPALLAAVS